METMMASELFRSDIADNQFANKASSLIKMKKTEVNRAKEQQMCTKLL
jgi:hypothetical protein